MSKLAAAAAVLPLPHTFKRPRLWPPLLALPAPAVPAAARMESRHSAFDSPAAAAAAAYPGHSTLMQQAAAATPVFDPVAAAAHLLDAPPVGLFQLSPPAVPQPFPANEPTSLSLDASMSAQHSPYTTAWRHSSSPIHSAQPTLPEGTRPFAFATLAPQAASAAAASMDPMDAMTDREVLMHLYAAVRAIPDLLLAANQAKPSVPAAIKSRATAAAAKKALASLVAQQPATAPGQAFTPEPAAAQKRKRKNAAETKAAAAAAAVAADVEEEKEHRPVVVAAIVPIPAPEAVVGLAPPAVDADDDEGRAAKKARKAAKLEKRAKKAAKKQKKLAAADAPTGGLTLTDSDEDDDA